MSSDYITILFMLAVINQGYSTKYVSSKYSNKGNTYH